jgi:hypothetical protein
VGLDLVSLAEGHRESADHNDCGQMGDDGSGQP